jgi:transglutaminase-like putative cysteine protease
MWLSLDAGFKAEYSIPKTISYSFTLKNETNQVLENVHLLIHSPLSLTPSQKVENLQSSYPFELRRDSAGNPVCRFVFDRLPPYDSRIVTIRADLHMAEQPNRQDTDPILYVSAEKFIEADDEAIIALARSLKSKRAAETARNIFEWLQANLQRRPYIQENRGARHTLVRKEGDCTGFMQLFTALCRAAGIPARCLGGYICRENAVLKPSEYHNWAEFFADGRWHICDPFNRVFMHSQADYVAMRLIVFSGAGPNETFDRFRVEGAGVKAKMNS